MKNLFKVLTNSEKITFASTGLLALFLQVGGLPFFNTKITLVTGIYIALVALGLLFKERKVSLDVVALGALFLVSLLWSFFHLDWHGLGRGLDAYFLLFTTPLFLSLIRLDAQRVRFLFWVFITGTVTAYFVTISVATYHYFSEIVPITGRLTDVFFHEQLGYIILDAHPTYFSLYGCAATLLITFFPNRRMWLNLALITFITLAITLLMARITLLIQVSLLVLFFGKIAFTSLRWRIVLLPIALVFFLVAYFKAVQIYDYQHRRLFVDFKSSWERSKEPDLTITEWGIVTRFALWRASWEVVEANRWFGIKPRIEKDALASQLKATRQNYIASLNMDSHNLYLSLLVAYGFVGVLLLFAAHVFSAWRTNFYTPYLIFLLIIALVSCTESILLRFIGVSFFAVIGSLLFFHKKCN